MILSNIILITQKLNIGLSAEGALALGRFFPELNEPARPTAARPVSCDTGRPAPGERGADRATG